MQNTEIKKALNMLKEAQSLLKNSQVANLRKSAEYLSESMQLLQKKTV